MTEEVKLDLTKPVQTQSGLKVRILCTDRRRGDGSYQILGLVEFNNYDTYTTWSHDEVHEYLENVPVNQEDAEANENCAGFAESKSCIHFNSHPENCQSCKDLELDEGMAAIAASIDAREANRRNILSKEFIEDIPAASTNKEHPALGYLNEYRDKYKEKKEVIDFDLFS